MAVTELYNGDKHLLKKEGKITKPVDGGLGQTYTYLESYIATKSIKVSTPDGSIIDLEYEENHQFGSGVSTSKGWDVETKGADLNGDGVVWAMASVIDRVKDYELRAYYNNLPPSSSNNAYTVLSTHKKIRVDALVELKIQNDKFKE
ncbi:hypothetical protein AAEX28_00140 [Lentisphaerota bacterium WC36G]|nr:hypothetical protein LJT99_03015 [Lentisphaerae bacterium WC36]